MGTAGLASAASTCDAYSTNCPPTQVKGIHHTKPTVAPTRQSTLPFTGGEIAMLSLVGVGAIGGGVVLVTAGRRRRSAVPA